MWCIAQFSKFDSRIKLDRGRQERIQSALRGFKEFCSRDLELARALDGEPFLQGSVPTATAVKPLGNDEYDVDVIYPFRLGALTYRQPASVLDWFARRVGESPTYRGILTRKSRCVRVNYKGDFHMDIIPSTRDVPANQPLAVPTRDLTGWLTNDPLGFAQWFAIKDRSSGLPDTEGNGALVRSVRMMKRWRDQFFGTDPRPSSILLATILGQHEASQKGYNPPLAESLYPKYACDPAYLYDLLRITHACIQRADANPFHHPTIRGEDLRRNWDAAFTQLFMNRLSACIEHLRRGIYEQSEPAAARHFQEAFGGTFPLE